MTNQAFELVEQSKFEPAVSALQQAIAIDPNYGHAFNELAFLYGRVLGQLDLAEGYARRAVECEPDNAKFHNAVNGIQMLRVKQMGSQRKIQEAMTPRLQEIQQSIDEDPSYPSTHLTKAAALAMSGAPQADWEAELEIAEQLYQASGMSGAGAELPPEGIENIITRSQKECLDLAAFWNNAPKR